VATKNTLLDVKQMTEVLWADTNDLSICFIALTLSQHYYLLSGAAKNFETTLKSPRFAVSF